MFKPFSKVLWLKSSLLGIKLLRDNKKKRKRSARQKRKKIRRLRRKKKKREDRKLVIVKSSIPSLRLLLENLKSSKIWKALD